MDFGSGFLDTNEVEALRALAVTLGVDPIEGTPPEFVKHYPHPFEPIDDERMLARLFRLIEPSDVTAEVIGPERTAEINAERRPGFVPCKAGAYPYCQKPESDSIHATEALRRLREASAVDWPTGEVQLHEHLPAPHAFAVAELHRGDDVGDLGADVDGFVGAGIAERFEFLRDAFASDRRESDGGGRAAAHAASLGGACARGGFVLGRVDSPGRADDGDGDADRRDEIALL
jgi:hypothetical protein